MRSIAASVIAASLLFTAGSVARADVGDAAEIETVIVQFRSSKPITPAEVAKIEENVKAAVAARPGDARVRYAKALFDRSKGDRKAAKQAVEALIQEFPDVAEYRSTHGTLCFEIINDAGMFEKMNIASTGRSEYEKAIALDSTLIEPRIGLTRFYLNAPGYAGGSYKRAEEQADASSSTFRMAKGSSSGVRCSPTSTPTRANGRRSKNSSNSPKPRRARPQTRPPRCAATHACC